MENEADELTTLNAISISALIKTLIQKKIISTKEINKEIENVQKQIGVNIDGKLKKTPLTKNDIPNYFG
jgi:hypothetical protein